MKKMIKSHSYKAKGFSLIELIIVMAILAILAAMIPMIISGYLRDSRQESNNNKAKQVYTVVQDMLVQMEIEDDVDILCRKFYEGTGTAKSTFVYLAYGMENGKICDDFGNGITVGTVEAVGGGYNTTLLSTDSANRKIGYDKLSKYLTSNISSEFTGTCQVFLDLDDFSVKSVIYNEVVPNYLDFSSYKDSYLGYYQDNNAINDAGKLFMCVSDYSEQKKSYKLHDGLIYGCYPIAEDVSSYAKV